MSRRDLNYEEQALEAIGNAAGVDRVTAKAYAQEVRRRLEHGAREYGDDQWWTSAADHGFDRLMQEVSDEATDQTGWTIGCLEVLRDAERDQRLDRDSIGNTKYMLFQAAAHALRAWACVQMARNAYREASGTDDLHAPRYARAHGFSDPD